MSVRLAAAALCVMLFAVTCSAATTTYEYDTLGRLSRVTYPNTTTITYGYDALGNRTSVITAVVLSGNADLSALAVSAGALVPAFASSTLSYTDPVSNGTTVITFTPTTADGGATVTVNGGSVASGGTSANINLAVGNNQVLVVVTAENGTTKTYTVNVTRAQSSVATLSNLTLVSGALSPSFASGTLSYSANVFNNGNPTRVVPVATDSAATLKVNGVTVSSGSPSNPITLNPGANSITVLVTAQDGVTTTTYTINANLSAITCTYAVSPADLSNQPKGGGSPTITVTASAGCPVTATSMQPWVTVNNVSTVGSTTTVTLQIAANGGGTRATAIIVGDRLFLVTQQPGP